jgi:hypothetical protein
MPRIIPLGVAAAVTPLARNPLLLNFEPAPYLIRYLLSVTARNTESLSNLLSACGAPRFSHCTAGPTW